MSATVTNLADYRRQDPAPDPSDTAAAWELYDEVRESIGALPRVMVARLMSVCRKRLREV